MSLTAVDANGVPTFGTGHTPFETVNLQNARVAGWPGVLARLRLKQWEHWLVVSERHAITFAAVDAAVTRLTWIQIIDRQTGDRWEHRREGPLVSVRCADALWNAHTSARAPGLSVAIHNHLEAGGHRAVVTATTAGIPEVALDLWAECPIPATEPLVVVLPVGRGRAMYSHKVPLPVSGTLTVAGETFALDRASSTAILDVHKAHYPRETWWNWATAVGFDAKGRRIAFNLTANVAEAGWHENAAWIDGKVQDLGPDATFALQGEPWRAGVSDRVSLAFTAEGERSEDVDWGVVRSRFRQRYGTFTGELRLPGGAVPVRNWFGLMEDHHARW